MAQNKTCPKCSSTLKKLSADMADYTVYGCEPCDAVFVVGPEGELIPTDATINQYQSGEVRFFPAHMFMG